jgi:hypothetical protein
MIKLLKASLLILVSSILFPISTFADHAWNDYHWARTTASFDLTVINSTTSDWDGHVSQAVGDWSQSTALNLVEDPTGATSNRVRRKCNAPGGMVRICNLAYGQTGWLGIAGISIDSSGHIIKGYTKLNDTYFSWDFYNNQAWKQSVTCQELGHNVGLSHQDEDFNNVSLSSCMDYQDPPTEYPNQHDYDQLLLLYGHLDSYGSYDGGDSGDGGSGGGCNAPPGKGCNKSGIGQDNADIGWGISLGRRGQIETFIRIDANGIRHITHVTWVVGF